MNILWIPHAAWHTPQRAHLFCRTLAERHTLHVTDWAADFKAPRDFLSSRYMRNFFYRRYSDGGILVHGVPRVAPAVFSPRLRRLNERLFSRLVERLVVDYRIDVVVGTFVLPPPKAPRLVFDLFDDNVAYWRSYGRFMQYAEEIECVEHAYLDKADAVVVASSVLKQKISALGARGAIHHIPNGVELAWYTDADGKRWRVNLGGTGRYIGLVGNHDRRPELDKFLSAAEILAAEDCLFIIAGGGSALPEARKRARRMPNVRFLGPLPRQEVPHLMAALDVGVCPYLKTPGAEAGSPMRLLQYSAAGLPVVCTRLEEVSRMAFPNVILVEDDARALAEGIRQAFQMPRARPEKIASYDLSRLSRLYEAVLEGKAPGKA